MLSLKKKDYKFRKLFFKKEILKKCLKFILINNLSKKYYLSFYFKFNKFLKRNSKTLIVRRCIYNNRSRGSLRSFGISRIYLLELLKLGIIPGFRKSVW